VEAGIDKTRSDFGEAVVAFRRGLARRAADIEAAGRDFDAERRAQGLPVDDDQVVCDLCGKWQVSYDSSRDQQLCEACTKLCEREELSNVVAAETDALVARIEGLGLTVERDNSSLSEAQYLTVFRETDLETSESVKIRVAAHEARPTYLALNGAPDFEVGNIGGVPYTQDSDGDLAACLAWLAGHFGVGGKGTIPEDRIEYVVVADDREAARGLCSEHAIVVLSIRDTGQKSASGRCIYHVAAAERTWPDVIIAQGGTPAELQGAGDELVERLRSKLANGDVPGPGRN